MLSLEEFVAESLRQVIAGVSRAQTETRETGAVINPRDVTGGSASSSPMYIRGHAGTVERITFDVAVSTFDETEKKAGINVLAGVIGFGGQGQNNAANQATSRIQFSLLVAFPVPGN